MAKEKFRGSARNSMAHGKNVGHTNDIN